MTDVKWSSATFVPQSSLGVSDYVMGLTSGNVNAKYSASALAANPYGLITGQTSYSTGTASQSGTMITGVDTTWTRGMLGARFIWPDGTALVITQVTNETSLVVSASKSQTSTTYIIERGGSNLLGNYWGIPSNIYGDMTLQNDLDVMGGLSTSGHNANLFGYGPNYNAGTVSQSGSTVTGIDTIFTDAMVGGIIEFYNSPLTYSRAIVLARNSNTSLTVDTSDTISSTTYQIFYGNLNIKGNYIGVNGLTLIGNFTQPLSATSGGTGVSNPTAHKIPIAQGAGAYNFLGPLTNGQVLIGVTGADPVAASVTGSGGIAVSNAAGSITIDGSALQSQNATERFVDTINGNDSTGNGSIVFPFKTVIHANDVIGTNATNTNRFIINVSGPVSEGDLPLYPFILIRGSGPNGCLMSFNRVDMPDLIWGYGNEIGGFENCNLSIATAFENSAVNLDDTETFYFNNCNVYAYIHYTFGFGFNLLFNNSPINGSDATYAINVKDVNLTRINSPVMSKTLNNINNNGFSIITTELSISSPCFGTHTISAGFAGSSIVNYDAISGRPTATSGSPIFTMISTDTVDRQTVQTISALKEFTAPILNSSSEGSYSTTTTISAADLVNKRIIYCSAVGNITLTLPSASDIETALAYSPSVNSSVENIYFVNMSVAGTVTIANGTNTTIGGISNPVILSASTKITKARKSAGTPAYIMYG